MALGVEQRDRGALPLMSGLSEQGSAVVRAGDSSTFAGLYDAVRKRWVHQYAVTHEPGKVLQSDLWEMVSTLLQQQKHSHLRVSTSSFEMI